MSSHLRMKLLRGLGIVMLSAGAPLLWCCFVQSAKAATWDLKRLRVQAEQGDPQAQFNLARIYDEGDGVKQDTAEALRWYRKSAEQGLPIAQVRLGAMYYNGDGVPQDAREGVRWWREAAVGGSNLAKFNLGNAYYQGAGVQQDYVQAYMWMDLTASHADRAGDKALAGLAVRSREAIAGKLTPEQIAEAQRLSREWRPKN